MNPCTNCEFRGYNPDICALHLKHLEKVGPCEGHVSKLTVAKERATHWGMKTAVGAGMGALAVTTSTALLPLMGVAVLAHSVAVQVSAGILGYGAGFWGYKAKKKHKTA